MGEVVKFRPKKRVAPREIIITNRNPMAISRSVSASPKHFPDLLGTMPAGHPYMIQRVEGQACPQEGQVWVDIKDDTLWVINKVTGASSVFYDAMIVFKAYHGDANKAVLDTELHAQMMIWNDRCRIG